MQPNQTKRGSGIVYLSVKNRSHHARLAVSIWSLRKVYEGPVTILHDSATKAGCERIASDERLRIRLQAMQPALVRRHVGYCTKSLVPELSPYQQTVFLDADTIVADSLIEFFDRLNDSQVLLTSFSDWHSHTKPVAGRLQKWIGLNQATFDASDWSAMIESAVAAKFPAINTGVFGFNGRPASLAFWKSVTMAAASEFICDELAMQIVAPSIRCDVVSDRFNFSPLYGVSDNPAVVHYHGRKHTRAESLPSFLPVFNDAVTNNAGGLAEWAPGEDKRLADAMKQKPIKGNPDNVRIRLENYA